MSDVRLLETQTHWSDESFVFWRLSCEVLSYESDFIDSSLPAFSFSFSGPDDLEHFSFGHWLNFFNRDRPLSGFFFSLLLDHIGENFGVLLLFSIHEIGRYGSFLNILDSGLGVLFFMLLDGFFHLDFLFKSFLVKYLGLESSQCLCFFGDDFSLSGLFLTTFLISIQSLTESLLMKLDIFVLRHYEGFW
jgi:hypothetical protein